MQIYKVDIQLLLFVHIWEIYVDTAAPDRGRG